MEALLEVRNLSIDVYGGRQSRRELLNAVSSLSFEIYPGEIVGIAGESGAGKSLTALSIAGLLDAEKKIPCGEIIFHGRNSGSARDLLKLGGKELQAIRGKEISLVFQEPFSSLNPLMRIGSQIAEVLKFHGERDDGRVLEIMKKLKLPEPEKLAKTYPHRLSGGMCQRVVIAMAVICRPRLLIADEPTTALDQKTQEQILALLKEINGELGTSILFVSHNLEVVKNLCDRLLVMYQGTILEEGNTGEIFSSPAHEYTRGLLNSIPDRRRKGEDLAGIPGRAPSLEEGRPQGCPFHPRCKKAEPHCKEEFPPERIAGTRHKTRCFKTHCFLEEGA